MKQKIRANEIKKALIKFLEKKYVDKTITSEVGVLWNNTYKIADIVLANGHTIAFEIKSEADNLKRLSSQIEAFKQYFDYVYIVYWRDKFKINNIDEKIGLIECFELKGEIKFKIIKKAYINNLNEKNLINFFWRNELRFLISSYFNENQLIKKNEKDKMSNFLLSKLNKREILKIYRFIIKNRYKKGYKTYLKTNDLHYSFVKNKTDFEYVNHLKAPPL
ncbi:sce7726 family protein [Caminibacter pacificus]